jgi:catalase
VEALTFELGKVFEQEIKERELSVLAQVDADLCEQVAAGLGLPAPQGTLIEDALESPALSQIVAEPGPVAGRKIGVIADAGSDLAGVAKLQTSAEKYGVTVLVIAPVGGVLKKGHQHIAVDRTAATARSIEFDLIVVAAGTTPSRDIKQVVMLQEALRHCKPLAYWGDGVAGLQAAGVDPDEVGVLAGKTVGKAFTDELITALGLHRVWDRAIDVMASEVAPAT